MIRKLVLSLAALSVAAGALACHGAVYTASNQSGGNAVLAFNRDSDGKLSPAGVFPTGGLGTGSGLGNQGAVTFSENGHYLYVVNAGSNDVSVFRVWNNRLTLVDVADSGGVQPISVTQRGNLVYVLNAGDASNPSKIQGLWQAPWGDLYDIPGATANLSAPAAGPAQIQFSPTSRSLVVTEKATNTIGIFKLDLLGRPTSSSFTASIGQTPFGFDFDHRGRLFVSEAFGGAADASAVSSYRIERDGDLEVISPSVGTTETAACWTVITQDGKFAYVTNTGSGSISGYRIAQNGSLALLNGDGVTGSTGAGSSPIDAALSRGSKYLYVLNAGTHTIAAFRVHSSGQLTKIDEDGGLPAGTVGLAAR